MAAALRELGEGRVPIGERLAGRTVALVVRGPVALERMTVPAAARIDLCDDASADHA